MRVGVLVPYTNTNLEPDFNRMCPKGCAFHYTRIGGYDFDEIPNEDQMQDMGQSDMAEPLKLIAGVRPDAVIYGCTSATLTLGLDFDANLRREIEAKTGAYAISAASAVVAALGALGVQKVALASPYVRTVNAHAIAFLATAGIEVVHCANVDKALSNVGQGAMTTDQVYALGMQADHADAQAIVMLCTDFRAVELIERLEAATGKPVVTSNQAMLFALLSKFKGLHQGAFPGQLFARL